MLECDSPKQTRSTHGRLAKITVLLKFAWMRFQAGGGRCLEFGCFLIAVLTLGTLAVKVFQIVLAQCMEGHV